MAYSEHIYTPDGRHARWQADTLHISENPNVNEKHKEAQAERAKQRKSV